MIAGSGCETVILLLLEYEGIDINSKDIVGRTPLSWAAMNGHTAVVQLLLEHGIDADSKGKFGQTPFWFATWTGREAVMRLLLENKRVDANSQDTIFGRSPLSMAAGSGRKRVVQLLLEFDVDTNSEDYSGQTALGWAVEGGHEAVANLLLDHEDINAQSRMCSGV